MFEKENTCSFTEIIRPVRGSITRICLSLHVVANNEPFLFHAID